MNSCATTWIQQSIRFSWATSQVGPRFSFAAVTHVLYSLTHDNTEGKFKMASGARAQPTPVKLIDTQIHVTELWDASQN